MKLRILDGIGPFFKDHPRQRINWSKIPWYLYEPSAGGAAGGIGDEVDEERLRATADEFGLLVERASELGFTHITLDDLAHLYAWPGYRPALRQKIAVYRQHFARLFDMAAAAGLGVLVTTDVLSYTPELRREVGHRPRRVARWLRDATGTLLDDFPQISGIVLRIGESDGLDVEGEFKSELALRSPAALRKLIRSLLPSFEERDRLLIVRTWSVGAYHLGDLIWNRRTFRRTFQGLQSDALVLSMKYGETDFYRYLPLNAHFFRSEHQKIVELQARREYEGFGEFPSFVGWQYADYLRQLERASGIVGFSIWCQTGGWSYFRRRTFLEPEGFWNELNVEVTCALVDGCSVEQAVARFCESSSRRQQVEQAPLLELLRLAEAAILDLLYLREFAEQKLFFRRLRLPPILSVYWDNVLINHSMRQILRAMVRDGEQAIAEGEKALAAVERMIDLAPAAGVPIEDLVFMRDTFEVLAVARRYYFREFSQDISDELHALKARYEQRYAGMSKERYEIHLDLSPVRWKSAQVRRLLELLLRRQRGYRWVDHVVTLRLLRIFRPVLRLVSRRFAPRFANETAMGVDSLLL